MTNELEKVISKLTQKLENAGFYVMMEFSAVDSLIHSKKMIGVISINGNKAVAETLTHDALAFCLETDYDISINLMGKSGSYVDYETLSESCDTLFFDIVKDNGFLIRGLELGKASASMPLKRLERTMKMTVRVLEKMEVA